MNRSHADSRRPARGAPCHALLVGFFGLVVSSVAAAQDPPAEKEPPETPFHDGSQLRFVTTVEEWTGDTRRDEAPTRSTVFDAHYLVYGQMPTTGTFEVALRASVRRPGDPPFVHDDEQETPSPKGKDRLLFISLDERDRIDSVFGYWSFDPFDHLRLSPVPPSDLSPGDGKKTSAERLHIAAHTYIGDVTWTVGHDDDGTTVVGVLTRPTEPTEQDGPQLTLYTMRYVLDPDGVTRRFESKWSTARAGKPLMTVRVSSDLGTSSDLREAYRFQRRAELATTKGQMRVVHPGGDIEERVLFASMLRQRLITSPYQIVAMNMFDDYIESVRPLAARYQAQLSKLEARYNDLLPDFAGQDTEGNTWDLSTCSGTPTILLLLSTEDLADNERLLVHLEPLRRTYGKRLQVVALTREGPATPATPATLARVLKDEGVSLPLVTGQHGIFTELVIEFTPTVLLISDQGILESSIVGFPPLRGIEKLKLNLPSILQ